jgi:hypothetical protein
VPVFIKALRMSLRPKPGVLRRMGEIVFAALKRQAERGLEPAKRGGQVTLHVVRDGEIWQRVNIDERGVIHLESAIAFLVEQYGGDVLRPDALAEVERELTPLFQDGLELVEG